MRNEFKLLNYKPIREDDRHLTVLCNDEDQIVVWNPNIREWFGDETEEQAKILEQADIDEDVSGKGSTIDEALADYVNALNKKTACFESSFDHEFYLVTFDFDNPANYIDDEDDDEWDYPGEWGHLDEWEEL